MNDASDNNRYWCHVCSQMINPLVEVEIKCPYCNSGFIEQMAAGGGAAATTTNSSNSASNGILSLWAPLLLGMLDEPSGRRMPVVSEENQGENSEDSELDSLLRRRLRIATVLRRMLHGLNENNEQPETENNEVQRDRPVIFINPYNNTIILQRTFDIGEQEERSSNNGGVTLGDYFFGPGFDALIQHLAENDPNRYGTPPAQKEAVEALPCVKIEENMSCPVCLEDFEIGSEAKEMPCKHKFHGGCLLPWLEMHSSCPVCRYQLPGEGLKESNDNSGNSTSRTEGADNGDGEHGRHRRRSRWPFISRLLSFMRPDTAQNSTPVTNLRENGS